jgi:hypothetical protein
MKITLMKPHEHYGVKYNEGDEIEVTKEEYEFLVSVYVGERKQIVEQVNKVESEIKKRNVK